ncbi:hypothetical protein B566_EDAN008469 [Ephemera danica]|nr:hypothetical protein B566_EDAN008469 [Ephemera danica]
MLPTKIEAACAVTKKNVVVLTSSFPPSMRAVPLRHQVPKQSEDHPRQGKAGEPTLGDTVLNVMLFQDDAGNKIWICPACKGQDDGSPMIGCDDCDAWYHWVCVGIQVPPDDKEDWYCRECIQRKQEALTSKKKMKKKNKV